MTCVITGCVLKTHKGWVGGDLHMIGRAYIFNTIQKWEDGETRFEGREFWSHYSKEIDITSVKQLFEKRGIFVFRAIEAHLNEAAQDYLEEN